MSNRTHETALLPQLIVQLRLTGHISLARPYDTTFRNTNCAQIGIEVRPKKPAVKYSGRGDCESVSLVNSTICGVLPLLISDV
jgi:hypothetical protein